MAQDNDKEVRIVVRFPGDVYAKIKALADSNMRSINSEVVFDMKIIIAAHEAEHGPLLIHPQ